MMKAGAHASASGCQQNNMAWKAEQWVLSGVCNAARFHRNQGMIFHEILYTGSQSLV